ncbi:MAG: hypothetical protein QOE90_1132 [Thermoplasmata archaeon]|jgi:uncharacterized protein (DUF58 family)|nr:hypothetical protein [Thermoplasmata archaeon]
MWTRKSTLLVGVGLLALLLGIAGKSPAALAAGSVALAFVLVNRALFRGTEDVRATRRLDLQRVYEGETTQVRVEVENPSKRLLFLEVRDRLPRQLKVAAGASYDFVALPGGARDDVTYTVQAPLLGVYEVGPTDLRLEDPFGLFYEERAVEGSNTFWVLPRHEDLRKAALLSNLPMPLMGEHQVNRPGDGFDFFALREYVPGDTMRAINWKASARSGKMMVNQMMRTTAAEVAVFIDARAVTAMGKEAQSGRVLTARAAASMIELVFARKDQPRVILYGEGVREIEPQPADRMVPLLLETLAELVPAGSVPLRHAVSQTLPSLKPRTPVILVSPMLDDGTVAEAASILLANDMLLAAVSPRPESLPGLPADFAAALMKERAQALNELRGYGAIVIDLEPGASLAATMEKGRLLVA